MKDLIKEYNRSLYLVNNLRQFANETDGELLESMASDLRYSLEWLKSGRRPGNRRGIERRAAYQRERPIDPIHIQNFYANPIPEKCTVTDSDRARIEDALSVLTEREREVYLMAKGGCLSYSQIAEKLNVAKGTVQDTLERAEKKIIERVNTSIFCLQS